MEQEFSLAFEARERMPLNARVDVLRIGSHGIGQFRTSPILHSVSTEQAASAPANLMFFLVRRGRLQVLLEDGTRTYAAGGIGTYRMDVARAIDFLDDETESIFVTLPMASLQPMLPDLENMIGQPLDYDMTAVKQFETYASLTARSADPISPDLCRLAIRHLTELVGLSMRGAGRAIPALQSGAGARRRQAIRQAILHRLGDANLSGDEVAKSIGVSPRYLQRLLRHDGTTFTDLLRHTRLQQAYALLADPDNARRNILSIALEVGFSDLSYFYRAFNAAFGLPPSRFRRSLRGPRSI